MSISQKEYEITTQLDRTIFTKIKLLDFNFDVIDEIEGVVIGTPTFNNNENSDIRRTCDISLIATDSTFDISQGNKIWLDRYIQIFIGIQDIITGEIIYTKMGTYLIDNPTRVYSATENTINFQCVDLMAQFTGLRNGYLKGMNYNIPANSNVRKVIIDTLKMAQEEFGWTVLYKEDDIQECSYNVPNDISIATGSTIYDILKSLIEINTEYQMYFDVDGSFHYDKIPKISEDKTIVVDDNIWNSVLISYNINTNFEDIKNVVEVLGHTWEVAYYNDAIMDDSNEYLILNIANLDNPVKDMLIGLTTPKDRISTPRINIVCKESETGNIKIIDENENIPELDSDTYYVGILKKDPIVGWYFQYKSRLQAKAIAQEDNEESPFYIGSSIGKIRIVLQDGNYQNLYSDIQCQAVANNELYKRCQIQNGLTLVCKPIYWLDVNNLVEITLPNEQGEESTDLYLVKSIQTTDTQSITLMRIYE